MEKAPSPSFFARHEFLIRRLHSLSGLIPVGAYMVVHLLTNATIFLGPDVFQEQVDRIHSLGALLPGVEWAFIFLPLLFHGIVGLWIVREAKPNSGYYPYGKNIRYTLQRVTGVIAFFYILFHVLHLHHYGSALNGLLGTTFFGQFDPHAAAASTSAALAPLFVKLIYLVGVLACVFHLANGIWTMGITWGVWISPAAQKRADYICMGFGAFVAMAAIVALGGFISPSIAKVPAEHGPKVETTAAQSPAAPADAEGKAQGGGAEEISMATDPR